MRKPPDFVLEIAAKPAAFRFNGNAAAAAAIKKRYRNFVSRRKPVFLFEVYFSGGRGGPYRPEISSGAGRVRFKRGDFNCILDTAEMSGELQIRPKAQSFDSFLRTLYSWTLIRQGGLLVHAAGLVKNKKAYLFPGRSGDGKSTLSQLASQKTDLISDELVPVLPQKNGFKAYGSPFWGELKNKGKAGGYPLAGVLLIKKSRRNAVRPCVRSEVYKKILRCAMNFSADRRDIMKALAAADQLSRAAPLRILEFTKQNSGFLNLI